MISLDTEVIWIAREWKTIICPVQFLIELLGTGRILTYPNPPSLLSFKLDNQWMLFSSVMHSILVFVLLLLLFLLLLFLLRLSIFCGSTINVTLNGPTEKWCNLIERLEFISSSRWAWAIVCSNERPCLTTFQNTKKRDEKTKRSEVFLSNFEIHLLNRN